MLSKPKKIEQTEKSVGFAPGAFAASVTSMGMIAQQVAGKAIRDAIFLSSFRTIHLPHAMAAASVLSLITVAWMPAITTRIAPRRLLPILFGANALGLVLEWMLYSVSHHLGAIAVYLHTFVSAPVIISVFWSLINERFDPHTAKPQVARIAGGGTIGGVVGGLLAWRASTLMSLSAAVVLLAGLNLLCMLGVLASTRAGDGTMKQKRGGAARDSLPSINDLEVPARPIAALRILREVPFLRNLAILVMLSAVLSSMLDYILGAQAVATFGRGPELLTFFSLFGLAVSIVSLLVQLAVGRAAIEKIALAVHIAVLPGVVILGGVLGIAVPGPISASLLRGAEMVHHNTLFRSAYELLYTPISELHKRATKAIIDVGCDRGGTIVGSLATMLLIYIVSPKNSQSVLLGLIVVLAITTLPIVRRLHVGYVDALEQRLRDEAERPVSSSGLQVGGESANGSEAEAEPAPCSVDPHEPARDKLIQRVAAIRPREDDQGIAHAVLQNPAPLIEISSDLLSNDPDRARRALTRLDGKSHVTCGLAIVLLAHKTLHLDARQALRRLVPRITGLLVDALLDPEMDYPVRRRIPPILAASPSQRAAEGLFASLTDIRFEVRYASGRALMRVMERSSDVTLPQDQVIKVILAEIAREEEVVAKEKERAGGTGAEHGEPSRGRNERGTDDTKANDDDAFAEDEVTAPLDVVTRDRASRGVEHLFTLLAVLLGSEAVRLCFRALHQDDERHRGTALEYLQTVLPAELRSAIWPLLGDVAEAGPLLHVRKPEDVLADLMTAMKESDGRESAPPPNASTVTRIAGQEQQRQTPPKKKSVSSEQR